MMPPRGVRVAPTRRSRPDPGSESLEFKATDCVAGIKTRLAILVSPTNPGGRNAGGKIRREGHLAGRGRVGEKWVWMHARPAHPVVVGVEGGEDLEGERQRALLRQHRPRTLLSPSGWGGWVNKAGGVGRFELGDPLTGPAPLRPLWSSFVATGPSRDRRHPPPPLQRGSGWGSGGRARARRASCPRGRGTSTAR